MLDPLKMRSEENLIPYSETATTVPAKVSSQLSQGKLPLDRSATQIEKLKRKQDTDE